MEIVRNFSRYELPKLFQRNGFKVGAEIGVQQGFFSRNLCRSIPGLKLYCIDLWEPYPCESKHFESKEIQDENYETAKWRLKKHNAVIIRKPSMEAVKDFSDGFLDFVFIDANHDYEHALEDITEWSKKVRIGGIVSGHDYHPDQGVYRAVNEYVEKHGITACFCNDQYRGPTFWWVKK